jgi:hypothetical protein
VRKQHTSSSVTELRSCCWQHHSNSAEPAAGEDRLGQSKKLTTEQHKTSTGSSQELHKFFHSTITPLESHPAKPWSTEAQDHPRRRRSSKPQQFQEVQDKKSSRRRRASYQQPN